MSKIIELGRSWLGWSDSSSSEPKAATEEDTQKFLRKQQAELGQYQNRLRKIQNEIPQEKNRELLRLKLQERDNCNKQIARINASIQNLSGVQQTAAIAESNVQTGLILKEANKKIANSTKVAEKIDIDEIVDNYRENATLTNDFSNRLSEPWIQGSAEDIDRIDNELDALLNQESELDALLNMPSIPQKQTNNNNVIITETRKNKINN